MISFPNSSVRLFYLSEEFLNKDTRVGQAFFNYFNCHKVTNPEDRKILDVLYQLNGLEAIKLISKLTDNSQ